MLVEDRASVEAVLDERDPSKLRIDIRVHPIGGGSFGSEAGEIQRAIREGFRDALREAQLERLTLAPNPQPKRRGWFAQRPRLLPVCGARQRRNVPPDGHPPAADAPSPRPRILGAPSRALGRNRSWPPRRLCDPSRPSSPSFNRLPPEGRPRASPVLGSLACINNKRAYACEPVECVRGRRRRCDRRGAVGPARRAGPDANSETGGQNRGRRRGSMPSPRST